MHSKLIKNNKGFTLIEMIIVIVLLGGIMSFLIPKVSGQFKTSSVMNARNEVLDMMRSVDDAAQQYLTSKTTEITAGTGIATLISAGILRTTPVMPPEALDAAFTGTPGYALDSTTYTTQFGTATADMVLTLKGVTKEVCTSINEKFGLTTGGAAPPAAVTANRDPQCFGSGGASGYTVLKAIYIH